MDQKIIESALKYGINKKFGELDFPIENGLTSVVYVPQVEKFAISYCVLQNGKAKDVGYVLLEDYDVTWSLREKA